jgi:nicotinate-nucleotide adenylyltransferase
MKVGLFGGSFNPPHVAHLIVAETVREQFAFNQILWMPALIPPHKRESRLASAEHRLEMTRLATASNPAFAVSDLELRRSGLSYTADTIRTLQETNPSIAYSLIVGGDSFRGFTSWYRPQEILERVPLIVYERGEDAQTEIEASFGGRVCFAAAPLLAISSTDIRERCATGHSIRYLVPEPVREYIEAHGLYGAGPG